MTTAEMTTRIESLEARQKGVTDAMGSLDRRQGCHEEDIAQLFANIENGSTKPLECPSPTSGTPDDAHVDYNAIYSRGHLAATEEHEPHRALVRDLAEYAPWCEGSHEGLDDLIDRARELQP